MTISQDVRARTPQLDTNERRGAADRGEYSVRLEALDRAIQNGIGLRSNPTLQHSRFTRT
jgi:hypothetical protein